MEPQETPTPVTVDDLQDVWPMLPPEDRTTGSGSWSAKRLLGVVSSGRCSRHAVTRASPTSWHGSRARARGQGREEAAGAPVRDRRPAKAIDNQLSVLRRVLVRAEEHELIDRVPLSTRMWAKVERPEHDGNCLVPGGEKALIAWLWQQPDDASGRHLALLVQVVAGLRFGELRALQKADPDVPTSGVHIRRSRARNVTGAPKNKNARFQPLPDDLSNNVLNRALRAACQSAGVREVSSHGLRRTAGSSDGYPGQSQRAIASMLGHADMKATERYVRVHERHKQTLVTERWNRLVNAE
jgi:integrase